MVLFGCLTYRNIRQTIVLVEEHADRQLTKMILIQVILIVVSITPYGIFSTYRFITNRFFKDNDRLIKENFAGVVLTLVSYLYYIVC